MMYLFLFCFFQESSGMVGGNACTCVEGFSTMEYVGNMS